MKTYDELLALITQRGVHAVFGDYGEGWGIEQNAEELARFLVDMQALGVESVLEIGTGWKAGLARFLADDMGWQVVSIDVNDYQHAFAGVRFMQLDAVPDEMPQFDLIIIDGDHTYEAVQSDYEHWGSHANKVIAFHDTEGLRDCMDVAEFWYVLAHAGVDVDPDNGLKPGYHEIVAEGDQRGGIGWIDLTEAAKVPAQSEMETAESVAPTPPALRKPVSRKPATRKPASKKATAKK